MDSEITIHEFVERYVNAITLRLRSHRQIRHNLRRFETHFAGRLVQSLRRRDVVEYIEQRQQQGLNTSSINIEIATLSAAINYAKRRWELDLHNPVTGLYFRASPGRLRYLERSEAERLLVAAASVRRAPYLRDFIELSLNTGSRKNELLQLQFKSIDFSGAF